MIEIRLEPEVEAQLTAEAKARGLAVDRYIETIVTARPMDQAGQRTVSEAIDSIRLLRRGNLLRGLKIKDLIHEGHAH